MKDFSTILLIKILRATVDHVQQSPEIDQAIPDVRELKRALLEQIVRLQGSDLEPVKSQLTRFPRVRNGFHR
jgi:hypothetical protein